MQKLLSAGLLMTALVLASCNKQHPPDTSAPPTVYKENAYELNLLTRKLPDGSTVFQLNKTLYVKGQTVRKIVVSLDTLPAIGRDTATVVNVDDEGEESTQRVNTDKEYDVLFKVDTLDAYRTMGFGWDSTAIRKHDSTVVKPKDSLHPATNTHR